MPEKNIKVNKKRVAYKAPKKPAKKQCKDWEEVARNWRTEAARAKSMQLDTQDKLNWYMNLADQLADRIEELENRGLIARITRKGEQK